MADPYIDQYETIIYGKFAREQMEAVCKGKVAALDASVAFAIEQQAKADDDMKAALDKQPTAATAKVDPAEALAAARDVVVRFGSYLDSLKGRPIDTRVLFRGDAPSVLARRRLPKLVASLAYIVEQAEVSKAKIRDADHWIDELKSAHAALEAVEKKQRAGRVERADLAPEISTARDRWLAVYNANKLLIRGVLSHAGRPELMPLVFDDLAEIHHASGVSDTPAPTPNPAQPS